MAISIIRKTTVKIDFLGVLISKSFEWIARLEGVSLIILLFIAMPLKYLWGIQQATKFVGLVHGILFLLFLSHVIRESKLFRWSKRLVAFAILSTIVPFGTFFLEHKIKTETLVRGRS